MVPKPNRRRRGPLAPVLQLVLERQAETAAAAGYVNVTVMGEETPPRRLSAAKLGILVLTMDLRQAPLDE